MSKHRETFSKSVHVKGDLICSFAFPTTSEVIRWVEIDLPKLREEFSSISYSVHDLDELVVGDTCLVSGDGYEEYVILELFWYGPNRPGFVLDSGFTEEVVKCYRVNTANE